MSDRRKGMEFSPKVKIEMFRRAGGPDALCCEGCRLPLMGKSFEYDHTLEIWEMTEEKRREVLAKGLTAEDGKLLGERCCHKPKSAQKTGERAHGERIVKKAAKATIKKGRGFTGWRKFSGEPVYARDRS